MVKNLIKQLDKSDFKNAAEVIRKSFITVAKEFDLNEHSFPTYTGFVISEERLQNHFCRGWLMFGLYEDNQLVGYISLSKESDKVFELHNLAVLPEYRHKSYGKQLIDFCKSQAKIVDANKIVIGIMKENIELKKWYEKNGFISTGTKKFGKQPITVEFMACKL